MYKVPRTHYYLPYWDKLNVVQILEEKTPTNYLKPLYIFGIYKLNSIKIFFIFLINFNLVFQHVIYTNSIENKYKKIVSKILPNEYF